MALISTEATNFEDGAKYWTEPMLAELGKARTNGKVGQTLVLETSLVRVWTSDMAPGERLPFHRHVLDYYWTALLPGRAISRYDDGSVKLHEYSRGETVHLRFPSGSGMAHDLENVGGTALSFLTVEFLDSPNPALPL